MRLFFDLLNRLIVAVAGPLENEMFSPLDSHVRKTCESVELTRLVHRRNEEGFHLWRRYEVMFSLSELHTKKMYLKKGLVTERRRAPPRAVKRSKRDLRNRMDGHKRQWWRRDVRGG